MVDHIYTANMADREELVETIVGLRQEKNIQKEQVRLLKTTVARLKK